MSPELMRLNTLRAASLSRHFSTLLSLRTFFSVGSGFLFLSSRLSMRPVFSFVAVLIPVKNFTMLSFFSNSALILSERRGSLSPGWDTLLTRAHNIYSSSESLTKDLLARREARLSMRFLESSISKSSSFASTSLACERSRNSLPS